MKWHKRKLDEQITESAKLEKVIRKNITSLGHPRRAVWPTNSPYRVLQPQRATLSIVKGPDDNWQVSQLKLACNQPVSLGTFNAVQSWLRRYSLSV